MRILLIDDDELLRRSMRRLLLAHAVDEAGSGTEAVQVLARDDHYDAVLCDVMMPGLTGLDVHARLRREHPHLVPHFAFMTGSLSLPQTQALLRGSARPCVEKPVSRSELHALVARLGQGVEDA